MTKTTTRKKRGGANAPAENDDRRIVASASADNPMQGNITGGNNASFHPFTGEARRERSVEDGEIAKGGGYDPTDEQTQRATDNRREATEQTEEVDDNRRTLTGDNKRRFEAGSGTSSEHGRPIASTEEYDEIEANAREYLSRSHEMRRRLRDRDELHFVQGSVSAPPVDYSRRAEQPRQRARLPEYDEEIVNRYNNAKGYYPNPEEWVLDDGWATTVEHQATQTGQELLDQMVLVTTRAKIVTIVGIRLKAEAKGGTRSGNTRGKNMVAQAVTRMMGEALMAEVTMEMTQGTSCQTTMSTMTWRASSRLPDDQNTRVFEGGMFSRIVRLIRDRVGTQMITPESKIFKDGVKLPSPYAGQDDIEAFDEWLNAVLRYLRLNRAGGPEYDALRIEIAAGNLS
ncbi:hypothetical protein PLICRDRAFT_180741 [Plicaturopsis crispa FD-325 SS-3]|uniref:Uncharacterized protein n=1 Tax=Plicaturopsis crispa FD-325 SS-3 TaxID=944288 RepID=A0A0C9T1M6_PLICR|nr:hypothetical protein PLICRDRAFT_180741 [Plicaturopsis crispa FD-325 SS-3]